MRITPIKSTQDVVTAYSLKNLLPEMSTNSTAQLVQGSCDNDLSFKSDVLIQQ